MKAYLEIIFSFAKEYPTVILVSWTIWTLIGLYGLYLSCWNTRTHRERIEYIKKWKLPRLRETGLVLVTVFVLMCSAILGPIIYIVAKIDHYYWYIRQVTMK